MKSNPARAAAAFPPAGGRDFRGLRPGVEAQQRASRERSSSRKGRVESHGGGFHPHLATPAHPEELEGLIRDRVREEVYYREAMALGLDKDDTIIRRRLRQKMEFLTDDLAAQRRADRRRVERVSESAPRHVSCPSGGSRSATSISTPSRHGDRLARDAAELLAQLNAGRRQGRCLGAGRSVPARPQLRGRAGQRDGQTVRGTVRGEAGRACDPANGRGRSSPATACIWCSSANAPKGACPRWMKCVTPSHREWANARRLEANEKLYEAMLKRYAVTIEPSGAREGDDRPRRQRRNETRALDRRSARRRWASTLAAHEVRPAYLELRQTGPDNLRRALEGARAGARTCASGSTWSFRRAARTSTRLERRWSTTRSPSAGP